MRHAQRGMSTYTMVSLIALVGFAGLFAFKVGVPILDNWTVKEILESFANDSEIKAQSSAEIRKTLTKKFEVNRIEHINVKDDVQFVNDGGVRTIVVDYEARVPFFANIDLVVKFEKNRVAIGGSN